VVTAFKGPGTLSSKEGNNPMTNDSFNIEVTISGANVRKHKGESFMVDERGNLLIHHGSNTLAIYPHGQWFRVHQAGNVQASK
jgi:L-asparaginase II